MQDSISAQSNNLLCSLPSELIISILSYVDLTTLVRCSSVCRLFRELVEDTTHLQYNIELGAHGLADGPRNLSSVEKLAMLRKRQRAWEELEWADQKVIPMRTDGQLYELYGGVLAQNYGDSRSLVCRRLPSRFRDIEERVWTIDDVGVKMRDFTMDPAQDLLVIIEEIETAKICYIHLRRLSNGEPHPSTSQPATLISRPLSEFPSSYYIQICGDFVGVCLLDTEESDPSLSIWNWKTRELCMALDGPIFCFAFLSSRHILVSLDTTPMQSLCVYDFIDCPASGITSEEELYTCKFLFPRYRTTRRRPADIVIRCDPCPSWTPPADVPFYVAPKNRVYVVTLVYDVQFGRVSVYSLFIPAETFLSRLPPPGSAADSGGDRDFLWSEWGPSGCRMVSSLRLSLSWVCWVYGLKLVTWEPGTDPETLLRPKVFDFNRLALRRSATAENNHESFIEETDGDPLTLFTEPMFTSYPYRLKMASLAFPGWAPSDVESIMLSEDSIIVVPNSLRDEFILLTF